MDSYDHLMTLLVNQTESDMNYRCGIASSYRERKQEGPLN